MKTFFHNRWLACWCLLFFVTDGMAQFSLTGQLRTRTELRNGQGTPLPKSVKPAFFTSQRTRLSAGYTAYRLNFGIAVQDVRVWGQDASTINRTTTADNNGLQLHEAWAAIFLTDTANHLQALSMKIGRQELVYDDVRLLGNLDWAQQARRHDAALIRYTSGPWTFHGGVAFNQQKELASGTQYNNTPPGNYPGGTNGMPIYKSMQFLYAGRKLTNGNASFLFFADQFQQFHQEQLNNQPVKSLDKGTWPRYTSGFYLTNSWKSLRYTTSAYYQFGKNPFGQQVKGGLLTGALQYNLTKKISTGGGIDYTTGGTSNNTSHAFDPLYGTPHKFWGTMDYFYVANGFGNKGLVDYYLKAVYTAAPFSLVLDVHEFVSASKITGPDLQSMKRRLGMEIDLTTTYALTKMIGLEFGYSHFFGTATLSSTAVKNVPQARQRSDWAYLMINIKPAFISK